MTNEELIEALTTLKEQAQYYGDNTFVWSINIDSFNFVIDHTIKALEQEPTTKNDLAVDCISRKFMYDLGATCIAYRNDKQELIPIISIDELPSVTPQEPQTFKWCDTCKEYDQVNHCCHRWSKVIKNTVEDMKREPIIDKIRAEIVELTKCPYGTECLGANCPSNTDCMICGEHVLEIIDNYKADKEG